MKNHKASTDDIVLFLTFAESRNSVDAAQKLGISQPTLTERLRRFDESLPVSPFSWSGKKRVLNAFGQKLYDAMKPQMESLNIAFSDLVREEESPADFRVVIAGRLEILARLSFRLSHSGCIAFAPCASDEAIERVVRGEADIAVTHVRPNRSDILQSRLFTSRSAFFVSRALLSRKMKHLSDATLPELKEGLYEIPWLAYREKDSFIEEFSLFHELNQSKIKRAVIFPDWMILKELMLQGKGCVVMPTEFGPFPEDVVQLSTPQQDPNQSSFFALYRREFSRGALATSLLADMKKSFQTP